MPRALIDIGKLDILLQGEIRKLATPRHAVAADYRLVVWRHAPDPEGCNWSASVKGADPEGIERIGAEIERMRTDFNVA
jgi:hypothetical protein